MNGNVTMEEKGVYEIDDALATDLIAQGLCADAATYFGGGSGGGVLVVHDVSGTLDKTWQEIHDADAAVIHSTNGTNVLFGFVMAAQEAKGGGYEVVRMDSSTYTAETANGYPSYTDSNA